MKYLLDGKIQYEPGDIVVRTSSNYLGMCVNDIDEIIYVDVKSENIQLAHYRRDDDQGDADPGCNLHSPYNLRPATRLEAQLFKKAVRVELTLDLLLIFDDSLPMTCFQANDKLVSKEVFLSIAKKAGWL